MNAVSDEQKNPNDVASTISSFIDISDIAGIRVDLSNAEKKAKAGFGLRTGAAFLDASFERSIDNKEVSFATRDGLASDSKFSVGWTYFVLADTKPNTDIFADFEPSKAFLAAKKAWMDCLEKATDIGKGCSKQTKEYKALLDSKKLGNEYNPLRNMDIYSVSISKSNADLGYLSLNQNKSISESKDGKSISVSYGQLDSIALSKWEVGLSYQSGWERGSDNKKKNICRSLSEYDGFSECFESYVLAPLSVKKFIPFFKYTQQFPNSNLIKSLQFRLQYIKTDAEDRSSGNLIAKDNYVFLMPIHMFTMLDKKLSAGIELSYQTNPAGNKDKANIGVFLKSPLTVF
ncbi:hypothetical protein [Pseudoalteromonas carrageenovora]|uniref:hypothetical protein n=1 Tax=Pseudoalteromonas carrageenovora TaxID=227 RepID=UPI0026E432B7|nr:hypothetical protein [Pseudoalteromonas carrageenovora]MDO6547321.1 hypothetical protein [Pseudoalteromonas carrageenovora]MDO6831769.1 hypothetical protein [Pseudoalteromonas carrageenovora]